MKTLRIEASTHKFRKKNLTTLKNSKGNFYDEYECEHCGIIGKSYKLGQIKVSDVYSEKKILHCNKNAVITKKIKVTQCAVLLRGGDFAKHFENLIPDSIHDIVPTPEGQNDYHGVWVMGVSEPVVLLHGEYVFVD